MRRVLTVLLASTALVAAGCGGDDSSSSGGDSGGASSGADGGTQVAMKDIKFQPQSVTVKVGDKVTWTNEDSVQHDVVNVKEGQEPKSDLFNKGGTYSYTPTAAGTIEYVCTVHPNMTGTLVVEQ
jgi:plastocyanin